MLLPEPTRFLLLEQRLEQEQEQERLAWRQLPSSAQP
jgi:hypothetical protein